MKNKNKLAVERLSDTERQLLQLKQQRDEHKKKLEELNTEMRRLRHERSTQLSTAIGEDVQRTQFPLSNRKVFIGALLYVKQLLSTNALTEDECIEIFDSQSQALDIPKNRMSYSREIPSEVGDGHDES